MIKAIAVDDEPLALKVLEMFCSKTDLVDLQRTFHMPNEALRFVQQSPVDLIFMDINMPSISGIDLYKAIEKQTMVIFTTAYSEYAVEGFNVSAIDYLLKPFTQERFMTAVQKANDYFNYQNEKGKGQDQHIFIRADYRLVKVSLNDILFIEGLDDYLKIHLLGQKPIVARMTMKTILEKLPASQFIRVHRSYIVPLQRIESIRNKNITINNTEIPIGSSYEEQFLKSFHR